LSSARQQGDALSNATRTVFTGGYNSNVLEFVTTDTTGNVTDFGDLSEATRRLASTSNATRGVMGGGDSSGLRSSIEFITIASAGNSASFGNLLATTDSCNSGFSSAHGGLQ
jgi:hypothetical protein